MPLPKPRKGETQDAFVSRCMSEAFGDDAPKDRTQEQAVAMCQDAWRNKDKTVKGPLDNADLPEPDEDESKDDFMNRCMTEVAAEYDDLDEGTIESACNEQWDESGQDDIPDAEKAKRRAKRIFAKRSPKMNKDIFDELDFPEPEVGENRAEYVDRCADEVGSDEASDAYNDEELVAGCEATAEAFDWDADDNRVEDSYKPARVRQRAGVTNFKTHAEAVHGMEFVLSDETPDRMGDIIAATGWDLTNFQKNPIALFNHNSNFPIGRWHNLRSDKGALRGHLEIAPKGTSARIDEIRKLIDAGILRAVSVGFRPIEHKYLKDEKENIIGLHFTKQELVETSLVSVPANPNALAVAKALHISPATIDFVFAGLGDQDKGTSRRATGGSAATRRNKRSGAMTLAQRITDIQAALTDRKEKLTKHWDKVDDSNVSDTDLQKTNDLNVEIQRLEKQHTALIDSEKLLAEKTAANGNGKANGHSNGRALVPATVAPQRTVIHDQRSTIGKKDLDVLDLLVRGGTVAYVSKMWAMTPEETRIKIYGDDEDTKLVTDLVLRAAAAPAMTTVVGWAAELVQQTWVGMMPTLMPKGILTRLAAQGLSLSFGRAGKINIPTRSRTPTIAGSFVGEGQAIPVRQGAFTSQALTPKKMAVITTWTREMDEHSIPAIEGILREAIQVDTTVAVDSVLIDANAATTIRPAGLLNGVAAQTATAGGGIAGVVGDLKLLIGALTTGTYGNIRNPVWLVNPAEVLSLSLVSAASTGVFPFKEEVAGGKLLNIPFIDSGTIPPKTVIIIDAADFVVVGGEAPRFELSDQATLHMEDTAPADLVGTGSPGTVASPQRSLFQTDSIALRMIMPLNWTQRRAGTIAWVQNVTW